MSKISAILLLFILSAFFSSCDSFLKENVPDRIELDKYFNNEEEAVKFLYGGYSAVKNTVFGFSLLAVTDLMTDDMDFASSDVSRKGLCFLSFDPKNKYLKEVWGNFYTVIEQTNILLDKIENNPSILTTSGNSIIAEARFIRGWAYFNLVQLWGEVPLITIPTYSITKDNIYPKRSSKDLIYHQIINDISYAATQLPDKPSVITTPQGLAYPLTLTRAAAKLLLAKVYLVEHQYKDVLDELDYFFVENTDKFSLPEYPILFDTPYKNNPERKNEVIWEMEADGVNGFNNKLHREMAPAELKGWKGEKLDGMTSGYQNFIPTVDLFSSFNPVDKRYRFLYQFSKSAPDSRPAIRKGYDVTASNQDLGGCNCILLRYADAVLIKAEALNELGDPQAAKPYVDQIRTRAGLPDLPDHLSQEEMRDSILLERRHEFAHEGYRLFDLRRTNTYLQVMTDYSIHNNMEANQTREFVDPRWTTTIDKSKLTVKVPFVTGNKIPQEKHLLHPVPADEIIANPNLAPNNNGY